MKRIQVCLIGTKSLAHRMNDLVKELMGYNFSIFSSEQHSFSDYYNLLDSSALWEEQLVFIKDALIENIHRASNAPDSFYTQSERHDWMKYRKLNQGDISVISKHLQAMTNFVHSSDDVLLILEDDALVDEKNLQSLFELINDLEFDYLDVAGGDNLKCKLSKISYHSGHPLEKMELCQTRTACGYAVNRKLANIILEKKYEVVMPIDWHLMYSMRSCSEKLNVYWMSEPLIGHGSSLGKIKSWRL